MPRVQQVFGRTLFLCRYTVTSVSVVLCVAKLRFEPLPWHLVNLLGDWDAALDPVRSMPHHLLFAMEIAGAILAGIMVTRAALPVLRLIKLGLQMLKKEAYKVPQLLMQEKLPKEFRLAGPAPVHAEPGGEPSEKTLDPRDPDCRECRVVVVHEMRPKEVSWWLAKRLRSLASSEQIWGRIDAGWIILYDGHLRVLDTKADPPPFGHPQLLIPMGSMARSMVILAASHASAQWLLLSQVARFVRLEVVAIAALGLLAVHVLVLQQVELAANWQMHYVNVLESQTMRLRIPESSHFFAFKALLLPLTTALAAGRGFVAARTLRRFMLLLDKQSQVSSPLILLGLHFSPAAGSRLCCAYTQWV